MQRRQLIKGGTAAAIAQLAGLPALTSAQSWPVRPVRYIVPFPAGGITDILARKYTERMSAQMAQPMVVDNRAGAGGIIGVDIAGRANPDGYTAVDAGLGTHVFNAMIYRKLPYNPLTDYTPVTLLSRFTPVLMVTTSSGFRTVKDVVDAARARPKTIPFGSSGVGSPGHILVELMQQSLGIELLHVPFSGGAPAFASMMADSTQAIFDFPFAATAFIQAGKVIPIAVAGPQRLKIVPTVPTMKELGISGLEMPYWRGIFLPRGAPRGVVERLAAESKVAMNSPDILAHCDSAGVESVTSTPEEFSSLLRDETARWRPIIQNANIKLDI